MDIMQKSAQEFRKNDKMPMDEPISTFQYKFEASTLFFLMYSDTQDILSRILDMPVFVKHSFIYITRIFLFHANRNSINARINNKSYCNYMYM